MASFPAMTTELLLKWLSESGPSVAGKCVMESPEGLASRLKKIAQNSRLELTNLALTRCSTLKVNRKTYTASALTIRF